MTPGRCPAHGGLCRQPPDVHSGRLARSAQARAVGGGVVLWSSHGWARSARLQRCFRVSGHGGFLSPDGDLMEDRLPRVSTLTSPATSPPNAGAGRRRAGALAAHTGTAARRPEPKHAWLLLALRRSHYAFASVRASGGRHICVDLLGSFARMPVGWPSSQYCRRSFQRRASACPPRAPRVRHPPECGVSYSDVSSENTVRHYPSSEEPARSRRGPRDHGGVGTPQQFSPCPPDAAGSCSWRAAHPSRVHVLAAQIFCTHARCSGTASRGS